MKATIKQSQLEELITIITKTLLNEIQNVSEESTTGNAAPINGRLPIVKRVMENDEEDKLSGRFVDRGEIKLSGGIDAKLADKIAHYHWDVMQSMGIDERGVFNYKTRGDRWCCSVGLLNGQPAILSVTTTPGRLQLLVGNNEVFGTDFLDDDIDTIAGLVIHQIGRVPKKGEVVQLKNLKCEIQRADPRQINILVIQKIPELEV